MSKKSKMPDPATLVARSPTDTRQRVKPMAPVVELIRPGMGKFAHLNVRHLRRLADIAAEEAAALSDADIAQLEKYVTINDRDGLKKALHTLLAERLSAGLININPAPR